MEVTEQSVCVVTVDTRRFFDECQHSYLPVMYKVFGVYNSKEKAYDDVWHYFTNNTTGQYEVCFDEYDKEGILLGYDDCFTKTDKTYGGIAYYGIDYWIENVQ